jgi:hypothetical protein
MLVLILKQTIYTFIRLCPPPGHARDGPSDDNPGVSRGLKNNDQHHVVKSKAFLDQIATAVAVRAEQTIEADLARHPEGGGDMPMRQRAGDGDGLLVLRDEVPPLSSILKPATQSAGQSERLSRARFLTPACVFRPK